MEMPIDQIQDILKKAAQQPGFCVLLSAPTGSGKSTRAPRILMDAGVAQRGLILVIQPRRLAARLLARYVAQQFPCSLGQEVGYTVRFDSKRSAATRLLYMTDGILERWLTDSPTLPGVSAVVFDEVHERRLSSDLCLARVLELQRSQRPDLGILVMSATLEVDKLQAYMPQALTLHTESRLYPVKVSYRPPVAARDKWGRINFPPVWEQCAAAVREFVSKGDCGDILVFLPGAYEIRRTVEILEQVGWMKGRDVFALHGQMPPEMQMQAVNHGSRPRVIVSTNIAETSLTIEGVRAVVDSGTARESCWDPRREMSTLHVMPISRAQADQRAGRAGRLAPGYCIRLWSETSHAQRAAYPKPEIRRADLSQAFLHLLAWGYSSLEAILSFPWLDAPTEEESARAWQLLCRLGAITEGKGLSPVGHEMLNYPLAPVLSRLLVEGKKQGCMAEMAAVASLIQGEDLVLPTGLSARLRHDDDYTDFQAEWRAVQYAANAHYAADVCRREGIMGRAAREIAATYRQLAPADAVPDWTAHRDSVTRGLLSSWPDQVAVRNSLSTSSARLPGKRRGIIAEHSVAHHSSLFLAASLTEVGGKTVETRLSRCTMLDAGSLPTTEEVEAVYDPMRKRVLAFQRILYKDLVLQEKDLGDASPEAAAPLLADQIIQGNLRLESWDGHVLQWLNRLTCLRQAMPELELPSFGKEDRLLAITLLCEGAVSYKQIRERPILPILEEWLSAWQRAALNQYAPKTLRLENDREVRLLYREDGTPVFGLKCQLLFGVSETPTVAMGRVRCLVEVLAPNQRPYQVTQDLHSFWRHGYPQMKKDLAGRYPRHDWPDQAPDSCFS